jgi:hypothetical protein
MPQHHVPANGETTQYYASTPACSLCDSFATLC